VARGRGTKTSVEERMPSAEETFRRLTIGDPALIGAIADPESRTPGLLRLDERTETLLRVGALVALDAPQPSFQSAIQAAQRAGVSVDELLGVVLAIAGTVGSARVVSAAPRIALAAGYDVDAALEGVHQSEDDRSPAAGRTGR
jgi:alkylhydroperoxidase/carboxymuconolactone decarboxylase family protein YurZ